MPIAPTLRRNIEICIARGQSVVIAPEVVVEPDLDPVLPPPIGKSVAWIRNVEALYCPASILIVALYLHAERVGADVELLAIGCRYGRVTQIRERR